MWLHLVFEFLSLDKCVKYTYQESGFFEKCLNLYMSEENPNPRQEEQDKATNHLIDVPEQLRPYFEAREKGELKHYYLEEFYHLSSDYLDDLPAGDVRDSVTLDEKGHFVGDKYKCRGNYIFGLSGKLNGAIRDGVINDPDLLKKIDEFMHHDFRFAHGQFTTKEEIDLINNLLNLVIRYLEKTDR